MVKYTLQQHSALAHYECLGFALLRETLLIRILNEWPTPFRTLRYRLAFR